jgi:hypothetical protein
MISLISRTPELGSLAIFITRTAMCGKVEISVARRRVAANEGVRQDPRESTCGIRVIHGWLPEMLNAY